MQQTILLPLILYGSNTVDSSVLRLIFRHLNPIVSNNKNVVPSPKKSTCIF